MSLEWVNLCREYFFVFFLRVCLFHPHTRLALPDGLFKNISKWFNFNSSWNYTHIWVYFWWSAFSEIERCWNWFPPFRRMIRFDVEKWLSNMTEYHRRLVHSLRNLNAKTLRWGRPENIELKLETKEERIWGNVKKTTENVSCALECRWEGRWNN